MAPKAKKGPGGGGQKSGKSGAVEEEREEPLQAVVFADSYETRFAPFTLEKPRCLLTLANTPLIEYTLEFLASVGAEEVYLYSGNHADQVEEYLNKSKWTKDFAPFSLEIIRSQSRSVGDAMRDLDHKQLIIGDFICVYGDVVANVSLEAALAAHRARRDKDKKAIMTMLLRAAGEGPHRTKAQALRPAFVIEPEKQRCVHYEQVRAGKTARLDIAEEVLQEGIEFDIREDLIDCGIDICTPEVLAQYTDNFDWQLPRRGFLYGVLKDYETNQLTVHTHVVSEGYAARVRNLQAYDAVSRDVLARWTYPLCPDTNLLEDQTYRLDKGNVYKEEGVVLARSSNISRRSVLGAATVVDERSVISNSVIGRHCTIGKGVKITGSYVWDHSRIEDGAVVEDSTLAEKTSVGKDCHVHSGALLSYGVALADGTVVGGNRITSLKRKRGYDRDEVAAGHSDPKIVGQGGTGFELPLDEDGDGDELVETMLSGDIYNFDQLALEDESASAFDSDSDEDVMSKGVGGATSRSESFGSMASDESGDARRRAADFHHEASSSIVDALQKNEDADTIQLELQALKLSSNAEDKQVRRAVAVSFTKRIAGMVESGVAPKDAVAQTIPPKKLLVERCVATGQGSYGEQVEFLLFVQTDLVHRQQGDRILLLASNALATNDLIEAEGFEQWWEDERSSATDQMQKVRQETKQLVDVLVGDDEESEEDDDASDDEDDG